MLAKIFKITKISKYVLFNPTINITVLLELEYQRAENSYICENFEFS